jgi:hypothetical protein
MRDCTNCTVARDNVQRGEIEKISKPWIVMCNSLLSRRHPHPRGRLGVSCRRHVNCEFLQCPFGKVPSSAFWGRASRQFSQMARCLISVNFSLPYSCRIPFFCLFPSCSLHVRIPAYFVLYCRYVWPARLTAKFPPLIQPPDFPFTALAQLLQKGRARARRWLATCRQ